MGGEMAGNPQDLSVARADAGATYLHQGRYTDAENAFHRALSLHVASNRHDDIFAAQVLNNRGVAYKCGRTARMT